MKRLGKDIVRANESEIVLSQFVGFKWGFRFIGLVIGLISMGTCLTSVLSGYLSETWGMICFSLCFLAPLTFPSWQFPDRTTFIQFNQPVGNLTIIQSPWWSIFIPAGPHFIKVPTKIPLPISKPFIDDQSGTMTYHVLTGRDEYEMRQSYVERYQVQLPLMGGKVYTLWTTNDRNTYIEIIRRINKAVQDYYPMGEESYTV